MTFNGPWLEYALEGKSNFITWKDCMEDVFDDHIVTNLHGKENNYAMCQTLTNLFHNSTNHKKLELKDKLSNIKIYKNETIPQYLSRFTQVRYELVIVGVIVSKNDVVSLSLLGVLKSWHNYQDLANGWEKLSNWEHLWSNLAEEEIRWNTRDGALSKGEDK